MEANNHFNYGTHPTAAAGPGLKRSSGDSLYTNGSSMTFPQQGKNMNGEMNVNGVTTVLGSGVPDSHPPTTAYPHMSNHQGSMGYDYVWGGQAQYSSAMGQSPDHGTMHQKQLPSGMMHPQSQHHYQGHGQYQLNGGMGSSHQPPVAGPPSMSSPAAQYWNRSNSGPQQMGFNAPSVYGSYQSHVHPGIASSQHHQQQSLQPPPHPHSPQHLHSNHHPQHHHHQQQQQHSQSQHYGMMPNGMPYYQPQHPPLPSPQPTTPSQAQSQPPRIPPAPQSFTPPRGSPQHHNAGRGGTSSPLTGSSVSMLSPTSAQESGSPQRQSRERSPCPANTGMPAVMQGNMSETYQDVDVGYNGMEKAAGGQRLPKRPQAFLWLFFPGGFSWISTADSDGRWVEVPVSHISLPRSIQSSAGKVSNVGSFDDKFLYSCTAKTSLFCIYPSQIAAAPPAQASALCVNVPSPQAPKPPPPTMEEEDAGGVVEKCLPSQPDPSETDLRQYPRPLPPAENLPHTPVSGGSEDVARRPEPIPQARPSGTAADDHSVTEDGSFTDRSGDEDDSMLHSTSRVDVSSSGMEDTSRTFGDADSSYVYESTRMDDSSFAAEDTSQLDSTCHTEDEPSGVADTTRDSHVSSSGDELGESQEGETSGAEETMDSFLSTRDPTLESSLNSTSRMEGSQMEGSQMEGSQMEESQMEESQMEESQMEGSQMEGSATDSFGPVHTSTQESEDEAAKACDLPDSTGPIGNKATVNEATAGPASKLMEEEITALMETPSRPPIPPITIKTSPASGRLVKTPGKPRKPRAPKASTPVNPPAEKAQRKPRARTPKVDKIKKPKGEGGEATKVKAVGRKRKKPLKEDAKDMSAVSLATGTPAGEVDPIAAIIEAVLARASEASSAGENLKKPKKVKKQSQDGSAAKLPKLDAEAAAAEENDADDSSTAGETNRRRVATEEQVQFPLLHGWRREIRVKKTESRMKGETWYYTPCGRRMKQFPEIIKYLKRHQDSVVSREHFSFSPRMPIGDFYEERETPEGKTWVLLANEEVPSIIMAITGRRGRPPNPDKEKPRRVRAPKGGPVRRPGRPPKPQMVDLLSKVDAKLMKRLEAKEALTEEDKEKIAKIKKKMKRKARMKRKEDADNKKIREEKKKAKLEKDQVVNDQAATAEPTDQADPRPATPQANPPQASETTLEPKKPARRRRTKVAAPAPVQQTDEERIAQGKRRTAERRAQAQRRLEERKRQQMISDELKKPAEDMCLTDHKPLPELSRVPGLVLSGAAFAHCLTVVEFLHGYGKVIGLNIPKDIPSLAGLQEGLLGLGEGQAEVQDLLLRLMEAALHDPGLSSYYQSVKILGEKLADLELMRSTVSEPLRIFLESHGYEAEVCDSLRTKMFHALPPDTKASILGFLVEELNGSNIVISDIDNTLENMATYRKNKWIIEGKLRKLKAALARRTGRSEEELCLEDRRRSARVAEEEGLEECGLPQDRASRRGRKEEPQLSDSESPTNASVPELERQIDKLTKRQQLFRKKLLQSSHSMRAISLGQDRFRRRYLALPQLGAILVEGPEELLSSEEVLVADVPVTLLKREPKVEVIAATLASPPTSPSTLSAALALKSETSPSPPGDTAEEDGLPGTASLMSQPRGRGRPRKIKPEVELHLRTAKIRCHRRSSARSGGEDGPGSPAGSGDRDLTRSAFRGWVTQEPLNGAAMVGDVPGGRRPEDGVKETAERRGQWFNLLPKEPCDSSSLTEPQGDPVSPRVPLSTLPIALAASLLQSESALPGQCPAEPITTPQGGVTAPLSPSAAATPVTTATPPLPLPPAPDPTPMELEQQYFTQMVVKPIPVSMVRGWWLIRDGEELQATLQALNPRGIREKVLHKHLAKHMESLGQMCTKPLNDPMFQVKVEDDYDLMEALQQPWQVQERVLEVDINALQWVEELEQRVIIADLHFKVAPQSVLKTESTAEVDPDVPMAEFQPYTAPEPDSTRDDLQYYEHDADPRDDWIVRTKKEWSDLPRVATHALDLAVLRLANLERNIERRYLKEPLWNAAEVMRLAPVTPTPGEAPPMDVMSLESEITPRLRTWRQALDRCRSAPQLCLCILQLEKAIAWERSVVKLNCQVCRKGDNDESLLLCDGCDRGCHMYCLRPKVTQVPEGDWFCPTCTAKEEGDSPDSQRSAKKRMRLKKRRYEDDSSDEETTPCRRAIAAASGISPAKRRRMTTRNQPDLTYCEIILMEMEAHTDAWPFLEPVNPRMVVGYRRIVKNPMDFLTMRERLLQGGYCNCEEFAADAHLVFNNCELFNEDTSDVGVAGHAMRRFFESRWAEFYDPKDK
ncbi:hypothetical protein NHX12_013289 [Muraenolepis orangiensis]|uniref:Bromodomain adjacent to zinc finger domain protein 2A n=1 Tax=Muraenolepis orangiensis TaxID=630683 RepID=A0A9Q0DEN7_9TELE|nr:hypothetical protein NHX12_013289 [Muraenolepis orangiensis]